VNTMNPFLAGALKRAEHRITRPRQLIFKILESQARPLTPKEIFNHLKKKGVVKADLVSIYRSLNLFLDLKLVHKLADGRYTLCRHQEEHPHARAHTKHAHVHTLSQCTRCGRSSEIKSHTAKICQMTNQILLQMEKTLNVNTILLQGVCGDCHKKRAVT